MNAGEARHGQLVHDRLSVDDLPRAFRPGEPPQRRGVDDRDEWEASQAVDSTDGRWADGQPAADGAPVAPPALPSPHPVLGAALRPPLTTQGQPPRASEFPAAPEPGPVYPGLPAPAYPGISSYSSLSGAPAYPGPPAPATDRFAAPEGYPSAPSPYGDGEATGRHAVPAAFGVPGVPGMPAFAIPSPSPEVDPQEQELWFHPRAQHASQTAPFDIPAVDAPPDLRPADLPPDLPPADLPPVTASSSPATVAIPLPHPQAPGDVNPFAVGGVADYARPAGSTMPIRPQPRVQPMSRRARRAAENATESAGQPPLADHAPTDSLGLFAPPPVADAPVASYSPTVPVELPVEAQLPEFARPASAVLAREDSSPPVADAPVADALVADAPVADAPVAGLFPTVGPPPVLAPPVQAPAVAGPANSIEAAPAAPLPPAPQLAPPVVQPPPVLDTSPQAAPPRPSIGLFPGLAPSVDDTPSRPPSARTATDPTETGPVTSSIPVIRPPVQVLRPDDDPSSATAETRSLRVTPPDAKALFQTPLAPKSADPSGTGGWSMPSAGAGAIPAANVSPPTPAAAPPPPVAPKLQLRLEEDAETGLTRRVVVIGGTGPGSTPRTTPAPAGERTPPPPAGAAPIEPPAPPIVGGPSMAPVPTPAADRPAPDPAMADWLGDLRGDDPADRPWGDDFGRDQAAVAATVVPARGREARQHNRAAAKAMKSEAKAAHKARKAAEKAAAKAEQEEAKAAKKGVRRPDPVEAAPPAFEADPHYVDDDLDDGERGRWLSLLVFWAPALILLLLAGVVIWLVR